MSPEAQRIAIAQECGWELDEKKFGSAVGYAYAKNRRTVSAGGGMHGWGWQSSKESAAAQLPDYLKDLNAMHEALKVIKADHCKWLLFKCSLRRITWVDSPEGWDFEDRLIMATAPQLAEAFLRGCERWEQDE